MLEKNLFDEGILGSVSFLSTIRSDNRLVSFFFRDRIVNQSGEIHFWLFEHLDLSDQASGEGEDFLASFQETGRHNVVQAVGGEVRGTGLGGLAGQIFGEALSDGSDLGRLGERVVLDLSLLSGGEGGNEHSQNGAIGGFDIGDDIDERHSLLQESVELFSVGAEPVPRGVAGVALDFLNLHGDLLPLELSGLLDIS